MHNEHHTPGTDIDGGIEVMHHKTPPHPEQSIKEGYEITDMNSRIIVISLIGLLILMWGACVVIVSSELPEVLGISDRVFVMREGRVAAEFPRADANPEAVLHAALPAGPAT